MTAVGEQPDEPTASGPVEARLRGLASTSGATTLSGLDASGSGVRSSGLDERTEALVRLAALVAIKAPGTSCLSAVETAIDRGATDEEVIGTMIAIAPTVGLPRLVSATVGLGFALGYGVDPLRTV